MATDIAPPRTAWHRLIRGQFGLRFLLLLMFLAALGAWWYSQRLPPGHIRHRDTMLIEFEMTRAEVLKLLGPPHHEGYGPGGPVWYYEVVDRTWATGNGVVMVDFYDEGVLMKPTLYSDRSTGEQ